MTDFTDPLLVVDRIETTLDQATAEVRSLPPCRRDRGRPRGH